MRLKLRNRHLTPSYGWKYRVQETGLLVTGRDMQDLHIRVKMHMDANDLKIPVDLLEQIEDHIAQQVDQKFSEPATRTQP
jgi:hypothetical protein